MASVLIVEDAPDVGEPLLEYLKEIGHTATCVANGREALRHVLADLPDVVVLDLLTPEMDGTTFLEVVRSYLRLQSLPVVVLTGLRDDPRLDRVRDLKVNTILLKGRASQDDVGRAITEALAAKT